MYNRYIPQSDGSYQRSRLPDQASTPPHRTPERKAPPPPPPERTQPAPCLQPSPCPPPRPRRERPETPPVPGLGIGSFLKNLLPREFDTEDLLVILLFLLMSKDCREDQNSALLTLALYLFM